MLNLKVDLIRALPAVDLSTPECEAATPKRAVLQLADESGNPLTRLRAQVFGHPQSLGFALAIKKGEICYLLRTFLSTCGTLVMRDSTGFYVDLTDLFHIDTSSYDQAISSVQPSSWRVFVDTTPYIIQGKPTIRRVEDRQSMEIIVKTQSE